MCREVRGGQEQLGNVLHMVLRWSSLPFRLIPTSLLSCPAPFRIVRKVPELMEVFVPLTRSLLQEKNHGVLVGAVTLMEEMCRANPDSIPHLRKV